MKQEQVIIVDKNDKIIGCKDRKSMKQNDIYRVSALWLRNSKGEVLLAQRAYCKKYDAGLWTAAAAGTVAKGETYLDNFLKEVKEEIGLEDFGFVKGKKTFIAGKFNFFCQWYAATVDKEIKDFKIDRNEVEAIKWFTKKELLDEFKHNPKKFLPTVKKCLGWFK